MFGLPGQTVDQGLSDLQQAIDLDVEHLSWYQLTLEPNTPFAHTPPTLPDDEAVWQMQQQGLQRLQQHGFKQYEISAFAQPDAQCQHNLNYWRFGDYIGLGAGAHAKISNMAAGTITRTARHRDPKRYLETAGTAAVISSESPLGREELPLEFMMNHLRLFEAINPGRFEERTGTPWSTVEQSVKEGIQLKLMVQQDGKFRTTERGKRYLNELLNCFF